MEGHKKATARFMGREGRGLQTGLGSSTQGIKGRDRLLILEVGGASPLGLLRERHGKGLFSHSKTTLESGNISNGNQKMHFWRRLR